MQNRHLAGTHHPPHRCISIKIGGRHAVSCLVTMLAGNELTMPYDHRGRSYRKSLQTKIATEPPTLLLIPLPARVLLHTTVGHGYRVTMPRKAEREAVREEQGDNQAGGRTVPPPGGYSGAVAWRTTTGLSRWRARVESPSESCAPVAPS